MHTAALAFRRRDASVTGGDQIRNREVAVPTGDESRRPRPVGAAGRAAQIPRRHRAALDGPDAHPPRRRAAVSDPVDAGVAVRGRGARRGGAIVRPGGVGSRAACSAQARRTPRRTCGRGRGPARAVGRDASRAAGPRRPRFRGGDDAAGPRFGSDPGRTVGRTDTVAAGSRTFGAAARLVLLSAPLSCRMCWTPSTSTAPTPSAT